MKKLIFTAIFCLSGLASASNHMTWDEILGNSNLTPDRLSYVSPNGASLFNVCQYDEATFKVINPGPECHEYKVIEIEEPRSGLVNEKVKVCAHKPVVPAEKFIKNTRTVCGNTYYETIGEGRASYVVRRCSFYDEVEVPTIQEVDVLRQQRDQIFAFTKVYKIPRCGEKYSAIPASVPVKN